MLIPTPRHEAAPHGKSPAAPGASSLSSGPWSQPLYLVKPSDAWHTLHIRNSRCEVLREADASRHPARSSSPAQGAWPPCTALLLLSGPSVSAESCEPFCFPTLSLLCPCTLRWPKALLHSALLVHLTLAPSPPSPGSREYLLPPLTIPRARRGRLLVLVLCHLLGLFLTSASWLYLNVTRHAGQMEGPA